MTIRIPRLIPLFLLLLAAGCATTAEKHVDLTYEAYANVHGGSGQLFIAEPVTEQNLPSRPGGGRVVGKAEGADVIVTESPAKWLLSALVKELSAAGYDVKTVSDLPPNVSKGVEAKLVEISANQSSGVFTVTTVTEIKLEAQLRKDGEIIKTLTAEAQDHEDGTDRSPEPIPQRPRKNAPAGFARACPRHSQELEIEHSGTQLAGLLPFIGPIGRIGPIGLIRLMKKNHGSRAP